jgi:hypothetical protein
MFMRHLLYNLLTNLFIISGFFLLFLCILDDFQPGFVSFWFDLRILLGVTLVSGLLALLFSRNKEIIKT